MQRHVAPRVFIFKTPSGDQAQQSAALQKLKNYLDTQEPTLARWLYGTWNAQASAIKYQELNKAIENGDFSLEYLKQWQQDYAHMINTKLAPAWLKAMEASANQLKEKYQEWSFDPSWPAIQKWVNDHGADLVVNLTQTQHDALKQVIKRAALMGDFELSELSRAIRPLVGLVPREAMAVLKYYESLRSSGMDTKKAQYQSANYAARVHRHRAMRIARTELCFAYNRGIDEGVRQAQVQGYMGQVQKRWVTADDERVCTICGPLDGQVVHQDEEFGISLSQEFTGHHRLPPAHPHCRCTIVYEEKTLYSSTWGMNTNNEYGTEAWLKRQPQDVQERFLGSKNKRILFEAGVLTENDFAKSLTELKNNGIIVISQKTIAHASLGEFTKPKNPKVQKVGKFKVGGHGQRNIQLLDTLGIKYNIEKTYSNGVRVGNVPDHKDPEKRNGIGQSWFPLEWGEEKIHIAGTYVANLKKGFKIKNTVFKHAVFDNVEIGICIDPRTGDITTIFPDKLQSHLKN